MALEKGKRNPLVVHSENIFNEIKVGMQMHSEEEAYDLYNRYTLSKGFSVQRGNKH